jgi:hypothetical protein
MRGKPLRSEDYTYEVKVESVESQVVTYIGNVIEERVW